MTTTWECALASQLDELIAKTNDVPQAGRVSVAASNSWDRYPNEYRQMIISEAVRKSISELSQMGQPVVLVFLTKERPVDGNLTYRARFCPDGCRPNEWLTVHYSVREVSDG